MIGNLFYFFLFQAFEKKIADEEDEDKKKMHKRSMTGITEALTFARTVTSSGDVSTSREEATTMLHEQCRDLLSSWLDSLHGSSVTEKEIFAKLAQKFEAEFHEDMQSLNVLHIHITNIKHHFETQSV